MRRLGTIVVLVALAGPAHATPPGTGPAIPDPRLERVRAAGGLAGAVASSGEVSTVLARYRDKQFSVAAAGPQPFGTGPVQRFLYPAGDLDGDGAGDVFAVEQHNASTPGGWTDLRSVVRGLRGANGAELWTREIPYELAYVFPAPHVGDGGKPGAFLLTWQRPSGLWRVVALGASGAEKWQRFFPPDSGVSAVGVAGALTFMFPLLALEDGTGDGVSDAIVQRWTYTTIGSDVDLTIGATLIDGSTGQTVAMFDVSARNAVPALEPAEDLDGDGSTDLLAASAWETSYTISALQAGGASLWTAPVQGGRFCFVEPGPDSDGDGIDDVVVWFPSPFQDAPSDGTIMISGRAGTVRWTSPGDFPRATHDVDGDGLVDVRLVRFAGTLFHPTALSFAARRGRDGVELYDVTHPVDAAPHVSLNLFADAGDADGDEVGDWVYDVARYDESWIELEPVGGAVSGADGFVLWSRRPGFPLYADVDGIPGADQLRGIASNRDLRLEMIRGGDGSAAWSRTFRLTSDAYFLAIFFDAYDLTGDGVAEVLLTVFTVGAAAPLRGLVIGADIVSQVFIVDGRSGADRWVFG